ncbi:MAG: glycyl radical protein [Treponema sp.]|jgi:formate C-acetyltransferase|nr:glycyl radical protein [Treponema sp.]
MTERVSKLRQQSLDSIPALSIERALIVTDVYKELEGKVSIPVLRANVFKALCERKTVVIYDGELIVGEKGCKAKAAPTYPELCCHTTDDFKVINDREKVFFKVDDDTIKYQEDIIIPFWKGKSMRDKLFNNVTQEWIDCYEAGIFTEFMEQRAPGHTVCDGKIYQKGFLDFKNDIENELEKIDFLNDTLSYDKREQLKAMVICCDAVIVFAARYADEAEKLAGLESDPSRKEELLIIADNCRHVPAKKPVNFWQAIQMYWFIHISVTSELNTWDAFSPGRLDQHLFPFYKIECEQGALNQDKAKELLECFWVKFNNQPAPPKVGITLAESGTYTDFCSINIGGLTQAGADGVNDLSYIILDVIEEMQLVQPSGNIQLSRKNPDKFLNKACKVIKTGMGQPSVFNADVVIQELIRHGKKIEDARDGGTSGCVEAGAFGKECYALTGYFNLVKVLEITLNNGFDPITKKQLGLKTRDVKTFNTFDDLFFAFEKQVKHFIEIKISGNHIIETLYSKYMPSPFLSILIDDCISNAKDYNAGGSRYNTRYIQGVGIGTLTDSLASIKYNVYDKNNISINKLLEALSKNFLGFETQRVMFLNKTPKYGNNDQYADEIMVRCFNMYYNLVDGRPAVNGGTYHIDMLPTTCHVYFGSVTGATADGRLAKEAQSEGISPAHGADRNGPTGVLMSAAKMDHLKTGGTLLNQKLSPSLLSNEDGIEKLMALIRTYFRMDGHHIQFNVINADTLQEAQKHPEKYKNLIVRVAGYSDYFNDLSEALQNEIIARTEQKNI